MADLIQLRQDTASTWASVNPILHQGELGIELDTGKAKLGDGLTAWNSLAYWDLNGAIAALAAKLDDSDATVIPAASKIPVASSSGVIDAGWMDAAVAREMRIAALGVNPTLDLDFARQSYRAYSGAKGLAAMADPFASFITFARSTTGTYFGPDGTMRTAAVNEPRIDYDPSTGTCLGLLLEGQCTNYLLGSAAPITQSVTVTAQPYTLSFYGTGAVALSGAYSGTLTGAGACPVRSTLTFTATDGSLTLTVSGSVQYAQLEAGAFASSYIPTTSSATTRGADLAGITGSNFSAWYNQVSSSCVIVADSPSDKQNVAAGFFASTTSRIAMSANGATAFNTRLYILNASAVQTNIWQAGFVPGARMAVAASWGENDVAVTSNGLSVITDTTATLPTPVAMYIGDQNGTGANIIGGHIRRIIYWPRRLTNAQLLELSK